MKRRLIATFAILSACSSAKPPLSTPVPTPPPQAVQSVAPALPVAALPDTLRSYAVPPFRTGPLMTWGPLPPGISHPERTRTYDLQHQIVHVRFDWSRHAVVGSTTLRLAPLDKPLTEIALDAVGMTIVKVSAPSGARLRYDYDGNTLTVRLPGTLRSGARTTFTVDYESVRPKKGAYFIDRRHVVWTQGETDDTRYWVPTYDYPNDKTTWEFFIRTAKKEKALSNGRLVGEPRAVGDELEWHWTLEQPNSTYLMTVVTGDFVVLQDKWRATPVGYWTYADSVEATWRGMGKTPRMIDLYSARTGVDYPFAKYDQANVPDYIFGGMENVTATTQADDGILHPASEETLFNSEGLVAHELGHQWYGDYLTTRDWSNVWLNEGFATFMAQIWSEQGRSAEQGAVDRRSSHKATITADSAARRPLVYDRWVTNPFELFFSGHIYPKGATVLQMLRHQLGDSLFWRAMNRYTTAHAKGNVVSDDLRHAFEEVTGRDFRPFFAKWVYGAGLPVFQVTYGYDATAHAVTLEAREVQARDSLTGFFDPDVDVEILTDAGAVRATVAVRNGVGRASIPVSSEPRSIRWDKGDWLLDVTDFPRPTTMLVYQLAHDDDITGRLEAVDLLADRSDELVALRALAAASRDTLVSVRQLAVAALARQGSMPLAADAILAATNDPDARVRKEAATSLASVRTGAASSRARELATSDSSLLVQGAALFTVASLDGPRALDLIRAALGRDSWRDLSRTYAVHALATVDAPETMPILTRFLAPTTSRNTRVAAIETLVKRSKGHEADLAAVIVPLLNADDLFVRSAAATALGKLGQQSAVGALQARKRVEPESRVINQIDAALARLGR